MRWVPRAVLFGVLALLLPHVSAHSKQYVNLTGDEYLVPRDCHDELGVSQGGVCFAGGHMQDQDQVTITISDKAFQPTSGCWQQIGRDCTPFCGSITLSSSSGWDASQDLDIFIDGPLHGNPLSSRCGTASMGAIGRVRH